MNLIRKPFNYSYRNAVFALIVINTAVFLFTSLFPKAVYYLGLIPGAVILDHTYWQFLTYQFVHGGFYHLLFNMLALFFFGVPIERKTGTNEFVLYYLTVGILSGILSFFVYKALGLYIIVLLGASGAIFGVMLLYAVLFPRSVIFIWGIVPVPAPLLILGYAAIELFNMFFSRNDGVAHLTHFIGLAAGWLYIVIRFGKNPLKIWNERR